MENYVFSEHDLEAAKKLDAFLPDKLYDAHMHISLYPFYKKDYFGFKEYYEDMAPLFSGRKVRCHALTTPTEELKREECRKADLAFYKEQLDAYPENTASIFVRPNESAEEIESHIIHKNIKGFKCYHIYADRPDTFNADLHEYLPEAAFEVANKHKMSITLHMVKDEALADPSNMKAIKEMTKKYPDATLILAHGARSFACWTAIEYVDELVGHENVWFDFSGICESPSMIQIMKKVGVSRCMWGSDYNVSMAAGKAVSLGGNFYWIIDRDLRNFKSKTPMMPWLAGTENLMANRQAAQILDLSPKDIEDLFYNNAARLFK